MQVWVQVLGFRVLRTPLRCLRASGLCMGKLRVRAPCLSELARMEACSRRWCMHLAG